MGAFMFKFELDYENFKKIVRIVYLKEYVAI